MSARKACGPDGVKPCILKKCAAQLSPIFTTIMNLTLSCHVLPSSWKCSEIIPIPKKDKITELNDLRPVALTSSVVKCMEKLVLNRLRPTFHSFRDPLQFAYREGRSVEDAILVLVDSIYKHIDRPRTYCRTLFVDFSSAFNTIQPIILLNQLSHMHVNSHITSWISNFLKDRTQYVKLNTKTKSSLITTNVGTPQGTVLSPVLFTIYTNQCSFDDPNVKLIKFADDSTILGLINPDCNETYYRNTISKFVDWCDKHFLHLNVKKTKEMIIDFRIKKEPIEPLYIKNEQVEQVDTYKYLGVAIDKDLNWQPHASLTHKKVNKRMFFLRKLRSFRLNPKLLSLFYKSTIESILLFCITAWGGNVRTLDSTKLDRIVRKASKITHHNTHCFETLYLDMCRRKITYIKKDSTHPLASQIVTSTRSNRHILIRCTRERYRNSFLPSSIKLLP